MVNNSQALVILSIFLLLANFGSRVYSVYLLKVHQFLLLTPIDNSNPIRNAKVDIILRLSGKLSCH